MDDLENGRYIAFERAEHSADHIRGRTDALLASAISDLVASLFRDEVLKGSRTRRIARRGKRGSRSLVYRVAGPSLVEVLRILHDRMDLRRNRPLNHA